MQFNSNDLAPYADFSRIMRNASSMKIRAGGVDHTGDFEMSIDDDNVVTIAFAGPAPRSRSKK